MTLLLYLSLFILGLLISYHLGVKNRLLALGLSFPLSFGFLTLAAFIFDILGLGVTLINGLVIVIIGIIAFSYFNKNEIVLETSSIDPNSISKNFSSFLKNNWGVVGLIGILSYLIYGICMKSILWPTSAYDSIAGFDFVAQVISKEFAINNSIFNLEHSLASLRSSYPPLVPVNFAYAYMAGFEYPKIFCVLIIISTALIMCAVTYEVSKNWFIALLITLLLMITPEYIAMSALSLTNVPTALYAGFGLIFIYRFIQSSEQWNFNVGSALLFIGMWTRTEVLIFSLVAVALTALWSYNRKNYKPVAILAGLTIGSFVIWKIYVDHILMVSTQQSIQFIPFYDAQKLSDIWTLVKSVTLATQYYGWMVYLFLIFGLSLILPLNRRKNLFLYGTIVLTWIMYIALYYQMNNVDANGKLIPNYITAGYRRGFFSFLPLIAYFLVGSAPLVWLSNWVRKRIKT